MMAQQHDYLSYLLRLWQTSDSSPGKAGVWRVMLEDPQTGEKRGFASLEAAFTFLDEKVGSGSDKKGELGGTEGN